MQRRVSCQDRVLPVGCADQVLAERFSDYFIQKMAMIRQKLDVGAGGTEPVAGTRVRCKLAPFSLVTEASLLKVLRHSSSKSCGLDPVNVPTWLLTDSEVSAAVLPTLVTTINASLESDVVPDSLKAADVTPLIRKPGLGRRT